MLVLSTLHAVLCEVLAPPALHTAVLFTPAGAPVSVATAPGRSRDDVRILLALASEIWAQTQARGEGVAESEVRAGLSILLWIRADCAQVGRVVILPVGREQPEDEPLLLLALNGTDAAEWQDMRMKVRLQASSRCMPLIVCFRLRQSQTTSIPQSRLFAQNWHGL
jgi:hypothetical protein